MDSAPPAATPHSHFARKIIGGTAWNLLAEGISLPAGFLVFLFLTRKLGPAGYGFYTLITTFVLWFEWLIVSLFERATVKLTGESQDWSKLGSAMIQLHLIIGCLTAASIFTLADWIAAWLKEPTMAAYLRLATLDIPIFAFAQAHRSLMIGVGLFQERAYAGIARWGTKLLLVVLLVQAGLSVTGAILANIGASLLELILCRYYLRPGVLLRSGHSYRLLLKYALPIFLLALCLKSFNKLDLFALKILGGSISQAGFYGAAQNLSLLAGILTLSFTPILLSVLTRTLKSGEIERSRQITRLSFRFLIWFVPFGALLTLEAPWLVPLMLGAAFRESILLFQILVWCAIALTVVSMAATVILALNRLRVSLLQLLPILLFSPFLYWLIVPRWGSPGTALVTLTITLTAAFITTLTVYSFLQIPLPWGTLLRAGLISGMVILVSLTPAGGFLLHLGKITMVGCLIPCFFFLTGEFSRGEISVLRDLLAEFLPFQRNKAEEREQEG
jgi:O-antigen/teichoic acid export membrane protein